MEKALEVIRNGLREEKPRLHIAKILTPSQQKIFLHFGVQKSLISVLIM